MNLYQLNQEIDDILSLEELDDEAMEKFEDLNISFDEKLENTIRYIKNLNAEAEKFDLEAKRLSAIKERMENKAERLKNYIDTILKLQGIIAKDVGLFKLSYRPSKSLKITDESKIPEEFRKIAISFDKVALKNAISGGQSIEGAVIVENLNLQIK